MHKVQGYLWPNWDTVIKYIICSHWISILIFSTGHVITAFGKSCVKSGLRDLSSSKDCRTISKSISGVSYNSEQNWNTYPKGCIKEPKYVFWNKHSQGGANKYVKSICIDGKHRNQLSMSEKPIIYMISYHTNIFS